MCLLKKAWQNTLEYELQFDIFVPISKGLIYDSK